MDAFEAYGMFLAMKAHFTRDSYDYFRFNGKVRTNHDKFMKRHDRFAFHRLSKKDDAQNLILASLIKNEDLWITDILDSTGEKNYKEWKKTQDTLSYTFKEDMTKLANLEIKFDDLVKVTDGQYPRLLKEYQIGTISLESLMILNDITSVFKYWNKHISDDLIWPSLFTKMKKYRTFLSLQSKHEYFKSVVISAFENLN